MLDTDLNHLCTMWVNVSLWSMAYGSLLGVCSTTEHQPSNRSDMACPASCYCYGWMCSRLYILYFLDWWNGESLNPHGCQLRFYVIQPYWLDCIDIEFFNTWLDSPVWINNSFLSIIVVIVLSIIQSLFNTVYSINFSQWNASHISHTGLLRSIRTHTQLLMSRVMTQYPPFFQGCWDIASKNLTGPVNGLECFIYSGVLEESVITVNTSIQYHCQSWYAMQCSSFR